MRPDLERVSFSSDLGEPQLLLAFLVTIGVILILFEFIGRQRLEKEFNRIIDLVISVVAAAALVILSVALGYL